MRKMKFALFALVSLSLFTASAQQKKPVTSKGASAANVDSLVIPISNADLGTFPYFKTLRNFYASDSITQAQNRTFFYDGKKLFAVDGKVSKQNLTIQNDQEKIASEFECIQEFDKVVSTLGGIKIYTGKLPEDKLKSFAGNDIVELASKSQVAPSAYYGVVEYVIKTPEKEVWVQMVPYSLGSKFYTLLVVEKESTLISLNTNKQNQILDDLEKTKKSIFHLSFEPDNANLLSESNDEILSIVGVLQKHTDWKLKLELHSASVGTPEYILGLTQKRAGKIKSDLINLGVNSASIIVKGMGDQKPLVPGNTEQGRLTNTRVEVSLQ